MKASAGKFLISDPFLPDPNFLRTVVYLSAHNEDGSVGFVLNRETSLTLEDVIPDFSGIKVPLHYGGPVEQNTLHFIHCSPIPIEDSKMIQPGVFWGGDLDQLVEMLRMGRLSEDELRFFIGYSGWTKGQLEKEIEDKAWFVSDASKEHIFSGDSEALWKKSLARMGKSFEILSNSPLDPRWN